MRTKPKVGDLVTIVCPGSDLNHCIGLVVSQHNHGPDQALNEWEFNYRILLTEPPLNHPDQIMMRFKWLRVLSEKKQKSS